MVRADEPGSLCRTLVATKTEGAMDCAKTPFLTKRFGFLSFMIGICIVGCASLPPEPAERDIFDELMEDRDLIEHANEQWESDCLKYKQDLANWHKALEFCNNKESDFIKGLSNDQLEVFSKYEESVQEGNLARTELCLRKIRETLNNWQKIQLLEISIIAESLEEKRNELVEREKELTQRKIEITELSIKNERAINAHLAALSVLSGSYQGIFSMHNSLQQSLQAWQQSVQQQKLRMNLYSINQSLSDIASAIRGY